MKKLAPIATIIVAVLIIIFSVLQLAQGIIFPGLQPFLLAILLALMAYSHQQKHQKRGFLFWLFVVVGLLNFIAAIIIIANHS